MLETIYNTLHILKIFDDFYKVKQKLTYMQNPGR